MVENFPHRCSGRMATCLRTRFFVDLPSGNVAKYGW